MYKTAYLTKVGRIFSGVLEPTKGPYAIPLVGSKIISLLGAATLFWRAHLPSN